MTIDPQRYVADMAELKFWRALNRDKDMSEAIRMVRIAALADYAPKPLPELTPAATPLDPKRWSV